MTPVVSVIVTTYNQEDTIGRTLDSILMQKCHVPYEIVIGEDHSTDHTLSVCKRYAQEHPDVIRLIANPRNKGLIDNYFDCLLSCRGKFVADCAGDDFWTDPLKLEKEVSIMEAHPRITLVHTDWSYYNETTKTARPSAQKPFTAPITPGKEMLEAIITQTNLPVIHLCTSLYRKDTAWQALHEDEYMFRNKDFTCEDLQIACAMAQQGDIAYIADDTLNYSIGHESISSSDSHAKLFRFVKGVTSLSHYLAVKYKIDPTTLEYYFQQRIHALVMHAFRAHSSLLFKETLQCEKQWNVHRTTTISILCFIMRHDRLWTIGLRIRKVFISVKRLFH